MKKLLLLILITQPIASMQRPHNAIPQSNAITVFREKNRAAYYPDVDVPTTQDWHKVYSCFSALLKLEFYPHSLDTLSKVTFADATRYCQMKSMFSALPELDSAFKVDPAIITRLTNLIMVTTFYPESAQPVHFGPPAGQEALAVNWACEKIWKDPVSLCAVLGEQLETVDTIHKRFEIIVAALRDSKDNPPMRNKLERT